MPEHRIVQLVTRVLEIVSGVVGGAAFGLFLYALSPAVILACIGPILLSAVLTAIFVPQTRRILLVATLVWIPTPIVIDRTISIWFDPIAEPLSSMDPSLAELTVELEPMYPMEIPSGIDPSTRIHLRTNRPSFLALNEALEPLGIRVSRWVCGNAPGFVRTKHKLSFERVKPKAQVSDYPIRFV